MNAPTRRQRAREQRRRRAQRIELAVASLTGGSLAGITIADYVQHGKVNDVLAGALLTLTLTALGRVADLRAQQREDDEDDA